MVETNVRIVEGGPNLRVHVREATLRGLSPSAAHLQRACTTLRNRYQLAAVPALGHADRILVLTTKAIPTVSFFFDGSELRLVDSSETIAIDLASTLGRAAIPQLVERAIQISVEQTGKYWTLDSPRIFWDREPFTVFQGIAAYRRFAISAFHLQDVGVGVSVEISTSFLTKETLAHYFELHLSGPEQRQREAAFARVAGRQLGQKGTLVYQTARSSSKCYFDGPARGVTCETTGALVVSGRNFASLADYYLEMQSETPFDRNGPVVRVSFNNLDAGTPVAAEWLRARVMNDSLPAVLSQVDKLPPKERREMAMAFWQNLAPRQPAPSSVVLMAGFWCPEAARLSQIAPPDLIFGKAQRLSAPSPLTPKTLSTHYRERAKRLLEFGCYFVPADLPRELYIAFPRQSDQPARAFAAELSGLIEQLGNIKVTPQLVPYQTVGEAIGSLKSLTMTGAAVFVLSDEPNAYYDVAYQLDGWRVKRITAANLANHHRSVGTDGSRGRVRWESFVRVNAVEVLQLLDAVPYRIEHAGPYEAQIAIDVGHDRRHVALSMLLARTGTGPRAFRLVTSVAHKIDQQHESINPILLRDQLIELVLRALPPAAEPVASVLILRDGLCPTKEVSGIDEAITDLTNRGRIRKNARVDIVEVHKDSLSRIRVWDLGSEGVENPLEGTVVTLDPQSAIVVPTGCATLSQGTAEPYLIRSLRNGAVSDAAIAALDASNLNWSSPRVAQRLPITLKRTDDELTNRSNQEIRRIR